MFKKRTYWQFYQPLRSGGVVQRSTETADAPLARKMARLIQRLADEHRWAVLDTLGTKVNDRRITVPILYALSQSDPDLKDYEASLGSKGLAHYLDAWKADIIAQGITPFTADVSVTRVRHFMAMVERETKRPAGTADLTPAFVKQWLAELTVKGVGQRPMQTGTRRSAFYMLKSLIRYLIELGVLDYDPLSALKAPKKGRARVRYESAENDRRIAEAAPSEALRALFAFIHATGAEVSPALDAYARDFDLDRVGDWARCTVRGTKTAKRMRHFVRIEPWAVEILRRYLRTFLPNAKPWAGITRHIAHHHHQATCDALQIEAYTLKDARHSWAVRARVERAESWEQIADQLGNTPYVVSTVYAVFNRPEQMQPVDSKTASV